MARVSTGLGGGQQPGGPKPQEDWRQPQFTPRGDIDWTKEQTPHPSRSQRFGRRVQPKMDVPELPERTINVRAKGLGTYYTLEGTPIPADSWARLPISPGLIQAIKDGNLERGPDSVAEPSRPRHRAPAAE